MGRRKSLFDILRENCNVHEEITEYRTPSGKTIATGYVISWEPKRSYDYLNPLKDRELPRNDSKQ